MSITTARRSWTRTAFTVAGFCVVFALSAGTLPGQESVDNHNSSRSNRGHAAPPGGDGGQVDPLIYPGRGSSLGEISATTIKAIHDELDASPTRVTERTVRGLLDKYRVSSKVKKIVVEAGKGGWLRVLLLQDPASESKARAVAVGLEQAGK